MRPRACPRASSLLLGAGPRCIVAALLLAGVALAGCGHPATREECEELFAKNVEIVLRDKRKITDPQQIATLTASARATEGEAFMAKCVGKRITKGALDCVRNAPTSEQADRCF